MSLSKSIEATIQGEAPELTLLKVMRVDLQQGRYVAITQDAARRRYRDVINKDVALGTFVSLKAPRSTELPRHVNIHPRPEATDYNGPLQPHFFAGHQHEIPLEYPHSADDF